MAEIFKVCNLSDNDNITKITVFIGSNKYNNSLNELIKIRPITETIFKEIFSEAQITMLNSNTSVIVEFTNQSIYLDDTIETIKKKIIKEYSRQIAFDEIYLFSSQIQTLDNTQIYDNLTQNGKVPLTKEILFQFISNITGKSVDLLPIKDIYSFNDIIDLNLIDKPQLVNITIGQHIITSEDKYSYTINPYRVKYINKMLETHADNIITTSNKDLLLSNGFIFENIIYMCTAKDVFKSSISKNISERTTSKIYFPYLKEKGIFDLTSLNDKHFALIESNKLILNETFDKETENVDLFHNIYDTRQKELNYIEQGVQVIEFSISQDYQFNVPLEIIFKLIHANKNTPFIKYNPSKKQENIYRLYCNKVAKNGKKIPLLSKNVIFKLMKTIGSSKRVSCYIEHDDNGETIPIIMEFDTFANVYIKTDFKQSRSISYIEQIIKTSVNPIIQIVKDYLKSSGYDMKLFTNLYDKAIDIINIKYVAYISIEKNINLNTLLGCVSSMFVVVVGELKKGIVMRYKRVANFNEMDSQEAFIVELLNKANADQDIVKALMDNFQLKETDAQLKIADLLNNIQVVQNLSKRRTLKIKNNPGFMTKITQDQFKHNIMIEMDNINNIFYMNTIPIYLDSLIRITQDPSSSSVDSSIIDGLCKTKAVDELNQINDIISPTEKSITENIPAAIIAQNLTFGEQATKTKEKTINVLDFLFEDDDDDDDDTENDNDDIEVEYVGGNDSSDSDEGIEVELNDSDGDDDGIEVDLNDDNEIEVDLNSNNDNDVSDVKAKDLAKQTSPIISETDPVIQPTIKVPNVAINAATKKKKLLVVGEETLQKDITGMKIADPNPFFTAMYKKDPVLFLTESDGKYSAYSRICPWNKRRQPVILTDEEKQKIDEEHPGSYDNAIKYGSDKNKEYWYICPRYWDLKNNTSLTEEEVKSGKYGDIIPQNAKTVPAGKNIWEFTDPTYHIDKYGKYINMSPGFLKKDIHPDGLRVPCCFKIWRDPDTNVAPKQEFDEYIIGPDKFPLEADRFGYLPFIVQQFIQTDNKTCQVSVTNKNLKKNQPCYLRKGVEHNKNKSFLACISDIYGEVNDNKIMSIETFIVDKLIPALTLDNFVRYQNGNLITSFRNRQIDDIMLNPDEYSDSKIYITLFESNLPQLKSIVSAYNNFKEYLISPSSTIDYEFLWDMISEPNPGLFVDGLNLVILELPQDDTTANINIICPSNFYSIHKFDATKHTVIIMKKYEYFEPVYVVVDKSKTNVTKLVTTKMFTPDLMSKVPNLKALSDTIQDIYKSMCKPLYSIIDVAKKYNFKEIKFIRNNPLEKVINILKKYDIQIVNTVINYDSKVIGLYIQTGNTVGFIPCYPSGILTEYPMISMDEMRDLKRFEETIQFLLMISKMTNNEILCKPLVKILEDGLIVGILTQTNQFVELIEPEEDFDKTIKYTIDENNYFVANKVIQNSNKVDTARIEYVKKIKLETELYNSFRNKLKMLFNQFSNKNMRDELERISKSSQMVYYIRLEKSIQLIKQMMKDEVEFVITNDKTMKNIEESLSAGDILLIPKYNLLSNLDNEMVYFSRISDELIRYNRIKQFMFESKMFLSFTDLKYNLNEDEIILLQSLLSTDYFDDLVPDYKSKYITFNSYDIVEPNLTQKYDNEYIKENVGLVNTPGSNDASIPASKFKLYNTCQVSVKDITSKLRLKFNSGYKEIEYSTESSPCSFDVALTIINNTNSNNVTINDIKNVLINEYTRLYDIYPRNILSLFVYYGMNSEASLISNKELSIESFIMNESYYLTIPDLLILANRFNFPITLIAPRKPTETTREILSFNIKDGNTFIVRVSGFNKYNGVKSKYNLIVNKSVEGLLSIKKLPESNIKTEILRQNNKLDDIIQLIADSNIEYEPGQSSQRVVSKKIGKKKLLIV